MKLNMAGFKIGHATDTENHTGCTVILCPDHTTGSVDVRGPAPGSREAALLAAVLVSILTTQWISRPILRINLWTRFRLILYPCRFKTFRI